MTNKRITFIKNALLLTSVGIAMRSVQLFLGAYISRSVGAETMGLNTLIMTAYGFTLTFATSGINLTVTRLVAGALGGTRGKDAGRILRGAFLYTLLFSGVATAVLAICGGYIGETLLGDSRTAHALRILSISLIPCAISSVISGYFVAIRRVSLNATVQVVAQMARIILTIVLLGSVNGGAEAAAIALAVGVVLTELVAASVALVEFVIDRRHSERTVGASFTSVAGMALPLATSAVIRSGLLTMEHSLIPRRLVFRGDSMSEALSSYGTLHGMALPLLLFPITPLSCCANLLVPEFAEAHSLGEKERMRALASEALTRTLSYSVILSVVISLFSEELAYVIFSSSEAGYYISFLAPVLPLMYVDHVADSMLKGVGEHIYSMWVNIIDACLSIVLVYFLIPPLGIMGYAVVILAMEGFNLLLSIIRLWQKVGFRIDLVNGLLSPLVLSLFACAVTHRLFVFSSTPTPISLIFKLLFSIAVILGGRSLFDLICSLFGRIGGKMAGKGERGKKK